MTRETRGRLAEWADLVGESVPERTGEEAEESTADAWIDLDLDVERPQ